MTKERILWADALKAFAIILVILGHCLQAIDATSILYKYIYAFHMPLFMAISGFCSYKATVHINHLKRRFLQLITPFFVWPLVWYAVKLDFSGIIEYYLRLPLFPDTGLWFLYVLFLITLVDYCRSKILIKIERFLKWKYLYEYSAIFFIFLLLLVFCLYKYCALPGNWINFVALYFPYYMLGCVMHRHTKWLESHLMCFGSIGGVIYLCATYFLHAAMWQPILAVCGIYGCFFLFRKFCNCKMPQLLVFTGMSTLGIYAVHQPIIHYVKNVMLSSLWMNIAITFVLTYILSILVVRILRISKFTRFLFLGMNKLWQ